MKILYMTGQLRIAGGIEKVVSLKINYLSEVLKHSVILVTYEQENLPYIFPISKKVACFDLGINYNVDYTRESLYSFKHIRKIPWHIVRFKRLLKTVQPDVVVIPNFGFEFYFLPFICRKTPVIREFHDSQYGRTLFPKNLAAKIKRKADEQIERRYSKIVVLTPDELKFFHAGNAVCIPNPVPAVSGQARTDNKIVVAAGRLNAVKGFDNLLVRIWKEIVKKHPDWQLWIFGEGDDNYKNYLLKIIRDHSLEKNAVLKGNSMCLSNEFLKTSVFVCTSLTESFGMVLVEAMSCGLPVVSFDCPYGPRNIIHHSKDGYLVKNQNFTAFCRYLEQLLSNENLRKQMGKNACLKALEFNISFVMEKWIMLFESIKKKN